MCFSGFKFYLLIFLLARAKEGMRKRMYRSRRKRKDEQEEQMKRRNEDEEQ